MNNPSQPKKRGRKKKVETAPETIQVPKVEQPQIIQAKNVIKSPENLQMEREKIVKELEEKAKKVDQIMKGDEAINRIHEKMVNKKIFNTEEHEWNLDGETLGDIECQTVALPGMIGRICTILEFLLKNGPMTRIDNDVFSECMDVLKLYYAGQSHLNSKSDVNNNLKEIYMKSTFYPDMNIPIYKAVDGILSEINPEENTLKNNSTESSKDPENQSKDHN